MRSLWLVSIFAIPNLHPRVHYHPEPLISTGPFVVSVWMAVQFKQMMSADVERQLEAITLQPYEGTYVKSLQAPCKRCGCAEMHFTVPHFLFHGVRGRPEMNVSLKSKPMFLQVSSHDRWLHAQKTL